MGTNLHIYVVDGNAEGYNELSEDRDAFGNDDAVSMTAIEIGLFNIRTALYGVVFMQEENPVPDGIFKDGFEAFLKFLKDSQERLPKLIEEYIIDMSYGANEITDEAVPDLKELIHKLESIECSFINKQVFLDTF